MDQEKRIEYLHARNRELVKELFRLDYHLTLTKANLSKQQKALKLLVEIQRATGFSRNDRELFNEVARLVDSTLEMAATYIYEPSELHEGMYELVSFHDTISDNNIDLKELERVTRPQWPGEEKYIFINSKTENHLVVEEIRRMFRLSSLIIYPLFHEGCIKLIIVTGLRVTNELTHLDLTPEDLSAIEAVVILLSSYFRKTELIKLHEADRFKSEFISNISHEFRTPLTLVLGLLEQLKAGMDHDKEAGRLESLNIVINNALRLKQLIDQLLDMSRIETCMEKLNVTRGSLDNLVTRIAQSFFAIARKTGIEFRFSFSGSNEESWFDEDKIEKILTNILDNAFKYTSEKGTVELSVFVEKRRGSAVQAVFTVTDTGRGIPARDREKVFERFYRSAKSGNDTGTGIGLYLVKKMATLHHGNVELKSQPGKGAEFTVRIPIDRSSYIESEMPSAFADHIPAPAPVAISLTGKKIPGSHPGTPENRFCILIVEDNRELNSFIAGSLSKEWKVLEAFDGEEGFAAAIQNIPDLIVTDVMMPLCNGYELCRRIRQNEKTGHIPVIMLTARTDRESTIAGLDCGAEDYISKPFDMVELKIKIRNHLQTLLKIREKYRKEFLTAPDESSIPMPEDALAEKVVSLMKEHLANPDFHVSSLCRELLISRTQLYRKIEALTGYSPAGLIRSIRLKTAAAMFRKGHDNVAQVMYRVGFSNQSGFARQFREEFGINPSAYIKRHSLTGSGTKMVD